MKQVSLKLRDDAEPYLVQLFSFINIANGKAQLVEDGSYGAITAMIRLPKEAREVLDELIKKGLVETKKFP